MTYRRQLVPLVAAAALATAVRPAHAGIEMNGIEMNGVSLNDVMLGGTSLTGVHLEGSTIVGTRRDGTLVRGAALVGAKLKGRTTAGERVQVRLDGYSEAGDVASYDATYTLGEGDDGWQPVCAAGGSAVVLAGTWGADGARAASDELVTFACPGGALAKCVDFGYAPWRVGEDGRSLAPLHQACTRAIRADFCGDGTSHTRDQTRINLWDAAGVQPDAAEWTPEAEWAEDGARCVSGLATRADPPPACAAERVAEGCGAAGPTAGALLVTELP
jgi:ADYC domain